LAQAVLCKGRITAVSYLGQWGGTNSNHSLAMLHAACLMAVASSTMGAKVHDLPLKNVDITRDLSSRAKPDSSVPGEGMRDSLDSTSDAGDAVPFKAEVEEQVKMSTAAEEKKKTIPEAELLQTKDSAHDHAWLLHQLSEAGFGGSPAAASKAGAERKQEESALDDRELKLLHGAGYGASPADALKATKQEARPATSGPAAHDDDRQLKLLQQVGFASSPTAPSRLERLKAAAEQKEAQSEPAALDDAVAQPVAKEADSAEMSKDTKRKSFFELVAQLHAPDPSGTHEVPKYFSMLPFSIKFVNAGGKSVLVFLDNENLAFEVPQNLVYIYPVVLLPLYTLLWFCCCMRAKRQGLSCGLVVEAAACFMCLWADLATKHRVLSRGRAWSFVGIMFVLMSGWHLADFLAAQQKWDNTVVFWTFGSLISVVWVMFAVERMFVRKFYRRSFDPMSTDHYGEDCCLSLFCGPLAALQEAQMMSNAGQQPGQLKVGQEGRW